jgi:thiamine pyrophosphokinase
MPTCYIFAAGDAPESLPFRPGEGDFVIAADAGYRTCLAFGITPDLLVGDFDSMEAPTDFPHILRASVEKDDTDTLLAVKEGLSRGCAVFHLYGGAGGRLDHTLANLQTLLYLRRQGGRGYLHDGAFTYTAIEDEAIEIPKEKEWALLSVFCLGDDAQGVMERGVQYPLTDATLTAGFPLGVSNHILEDTARISVARGALLIGWER